MGVGSEVGHVEDSSVQVDMLVHGGGPENRHETGLTAAPGEALAGRDVTDPGPAAVGADLEPAQGLDALDADERRCGRGHPPGPRVHCQPAALIGDMTSNYVH